MNSELILLYWDIGQGIVEKQESSGWGENVVELAASDLRRAFPQVTGFSLANIWRMRQLFTTYNDPEFLAQLARDLGKGASRQKNAILAQAVRELAAKIPWGHHVLLLGRIKSAPALLYYLQATARFGWSRNVLLNQIKAEAYERSVTDKKSHNFGLALPEHLAEQADEMLKSSYSLEFLGIRRAVRERELEDRLILCAEKDDIEVEYALRSKNNPIGVATYQLQSKLPGELKGKLPTAKQLTDIVKAGLEEEKP